MNSSTIKAVLLSAGPGKRLRPISNYLPKNMLSIAGKPILQYIIEDLKNAGIKDIGIVVSHFKKEIIDYFGNGRRFGVRITYIDQKNPHGTAHAILATRSFVKDKPFLVYLADTLIPDGLIPFVNRVSKIKKGNLLMVSSLPKKELKQAGVVEIDGTNIIKLQEKSKNPSSNLAIAGVYYFNSDNLFDVIKQLPAGRQNEIQITDAVQSLIDMGETVRIFKTKMRYIDTGTLQGVLEANRYLLSNINDVVLGWGCKVDKNIKLKSPAYIGNKCRIEQSEIGPFVSIGDNTIIRKGARIKNSVLMNSSRIKQNSTIISSIMKNRSCKLSRSNARPIEFIASK